ncbi:hypothetical protein GR183_12690 [Stappia sp. GBMRC 2046]|uniref:Uncharacterized protein n=1 Tax=Stappia sediminis TaxID=2692190 RepID=A0A7X3LV95_9HYPH|nr:hypothetical protein [Stappia sediminis]MXN65765.1 hypothetical protein [Stappia sediminis]
MRPIVHISGLALAVIAHTGETRAADDLRGLPVLGQERELFLEETTALRGSIGVRTWISRSELRQKLKSGAGATLADYDFTQSDSASAEVFFTLQDDDSGAFLKGAAALGVLTGGDFREVDYDSFTSQSI